jgi:hypothetical protein
MSSTVALQFQGTDDLTLLPRSTATIYTKPIKYDGATGASIFLSDTLDAALNVSVEASSDGNNWAPRGTAFNVGASPAGGIAVIDVDDLPKLGRAYPWIRLKIVPVAAPTAGTLGGQIHRQFI